MDSCQPLFAPLTSSYSVPPVPDKTQHLWRFGLFTSLDGYSTLKRSRNFRTQDVDVVSRKDDPETAAISLITAIPENEVRNLLGNNPKKDQSQEIIMANILEPGKNLIQP